MIRNITFFAVITLLNITFLYSQNKWELVKDSENIKVYISEESNSEGYINLKATTYASGSVEAFVSVMEDVSNYKKWMHAVEETYIVEQQDDYQFIYYMLTDFPWPAKDRDAVISMEFNYNPKTNTFKTISGNVKGLVPEKENLQRVKEVKASYTFIQQSNNKVHIEYQGRIKPGVSLPDWIMEKVYHIAPYNTLKNLRSFVLEGKYQNTDFDLNDI